MWPANDGNLSARCSDGGVLITPSGVYKGDLEEDMLLEVDLEGRVLSGTGRPSSESRCIWLSTVPGLRWEA